MRRCLRANAVARSIVRSVLCAAAVGLAFSADPPDTKVNAQSGFVEVTDAIWSSTNYNIRHTIDRGELPDIVFTLSNHAADDLDPKLAITSGGDTWVAWWRDLATDEVRCRRRSYGSGTWSADVLVGQTGESSRNPALAIDGTFAWIAYEVTSGATTSVAITGGENPDPLPTRTIVRTTSYTGNLDTQVHAESSKLWVTWVDSGTDVGWSEYDHASSSWSAPAYESYGADSVTAARGRIRESVLGN